MNEGRVWALGALMKAFAVEARIRSPGGMLQPFRGEVGAVIRRSDGQFQCDFASSAMAGGGMLHAPYPDWVYSQSVAYIRHDLAYRQLALVDGQGQELPFIPPLADESGSSLFPAASYAGWISHADGGREPFKAHVGSPVPGGIGFECPVSCSRYPKLSPSRSDWPEQAYELAFMLLRQLLLADGATLSDEGGRRLDLIAPVG